MSIGTSLFLVAVGAILRFAVTASVSGLNIQTIGLILMIVGIAGLILSIVWMLWWADATRQRREETIVRDPRDYRPRDYH